MTQLTLQELIDALAAAPLDLYVKEGFARSHSYRGIYAHVAFSPASNVSLRSMLQDARSALNRVYTGYKGGSYMMRADTPCWLASEGSPDGIEVTQEWMDAAIATAGYATRDCWLIETNSDLTEGRGRTIPLYVCETEATAIRLAKGRYVQGGNAPVSPVQLLSIGGYWYGPIDVIKATDEDLKTQAATAAKREAIRRAKEAGLSDSDIEALQRT